MTWSALAPAARLVDLIEAILTDLGHDPDDPVVDQTVHQRLVLVSGYPAPLAIEAPR